jgi:hypothetical protein
MAMGEQCVEPAAQPTRSRLCRIKPHRRILSPVDGGVNAATNPVWYLRFEVVKLKASMLVMVGYTITRLYLLLGG